MRRHPELDDRTVEDILNGRSAALEGADRLLAEAMTGLRSAALASTPQPNDELRLVFAEGIPAEPGQSAPIARVSRRSGGRAVTPTRVTRIAGLGLATKLLLAGAAAAATAVGGAGAAGVLPWQGGELPPAEAPAEAEADDGLEVADEVTPDRAPGTDLADEARQIRDAGERREEAARNEEAERSEEVHRSDRAADEPGDSGLDEATEHTERAPESVPQSGDTGREHAEDRRDEARTGSRSGADDTPSGERSEPADGARAPAGTSSFETSGNVGTQDLDDPDGSHDRDQGADRAGPKSP